MRPLSQSRRFPPWPIRFPGVGIVAAGLGVVITMGALGGPPEEIAKSRCGPGGNVSRNSALLRAGWPDRSKHGKSADEERAYLNVLKVLIVCFLKGTAPIMAVEAARRAIPGHVRPTFTELEQACRGGSASSTATPEAPGSEAPAAEAASSGG